MIFFYTLGNLKWNKNYREKNIIIMNTEIFSTVQIKTENFKIIDTKQFNSTNNTVYQIASCSKFIY